MSVTILRPRQMIHLAFLGASLAIAPGLAGSATAKELSAKLAREAATLTVEQRIRLVNRLGVDFSCTNVASDACARRIDGRIRRLLPALSAEQAETNAALRLAAWVAAQDGNPVVKAKKPKAKKPANELTREERAQRRLKRQQRQAERAAANKDAKPQDVVRETITAEMARNSGQERAQQSDDNNNLLKILGAVGAVGAGVAIGQLLDNGDEVVSNEGDRVVVRRDGELFLRRDEGALLRRPGSDVQTERFADGSTRTTVTRQNGVRVVTIRDADGNSVRRTRILQDGTQVLLFDDTAEQASAQLTEQDLAAIQVARRAQRQAEARAANNTTLSTQERLERALQRERLALDRGFSLRQVRENIALRDMVSPIDLDEVTFRSGSSVITPREAGALAELGETLAELIRRNPNEVFLIEGHTDAVGAETLNLALSDRRAESVALALTEYFDVPPESMVVQGYGENYLKIETQDKERQNRRVTVRRITSLLRSAQSN